MNASAPLLNDYYGKKDKMKLQFRKRIRIADLPQCQIFNPQAVQSLVLHAQHLRSYSLIFSGAIEGFSLLLLILLFIFWRKDERARGNRSGRSHFFCITLLCLVNVAAIATFLAFVIISCTSLQYRNLKSFVAFKCFENAALLLAITKAEIYI